MAIGVLLIIVALLAVVSLTRVRASLAFFGVICGFYIFNLIPFEKFISGFTNISVLSLVLLIIISAVISKTRLRQQIRNFSWNRKRHISQIAMIVAALSAFLNNLFVVSLFLQAFSKRKQLSRILMPISYMSIVAGTATLIGTSTNLVANALIIERGLPPLGMFDFAWIGVPLIIFGVLYVTYATHKLLPDNPETGETEESRYFVEAEVAGSSPLVGKTVVDNNLRNLESLFLSEIIRGDRLISPVRPDETVLAGDTLVFAGQIENIKELQRFKGLRVFDQHHEVLNRNLVSVVLSHQSELVGQTIKNANFRSRFNAAVVAINRGDERLAGKIGAIRLAAGDNLILAVGKDFADNEAVRTHFYLVSDVEVTDSFSRRDSWIILLSFVAAVAVGAFGMWPLFKALLVLVLFYLVRGYLSFQTLRRSLDMDFYFIAASSLVISTVLVDAGSAKLMADSMRGLLHGGSPYVMLVGLYLMTVVLTELISNMAAAAFVIPIALEIAAGLGVSPMPFIFGTIYGASAGFLWPYGYHTHVIVFSAGGYKVSDFVRYGLGFTLVYAIIVLLLLPVVFPFTP